MSKSEHIRERLRAQGMEQVGTDAGGGELWHEATVSAPRLYSVADVVAWLRQQSAGYSAHADKLPMGPERATASAFAKTLDCIARDLADDADGGPGLAGLIAEAEHRAAFRAAEEMRERCAARVRALAEDPHGDLSHDWSGGWEAAVEEAERAVRALPTVPR